MIQRLADDRAQPELGHQDMLNWADFFREQARRKGVQTIDTSRLTPDQVAEALERTVLVRLREAATLPQ